MALLRAVDSANFFEKTRRLATLMRQGGKCLDISGEAWPPKGRTRTQIFAANAAIVSQRAYNRIEICAVDPAAKGNSQS